MAQVYLINKASFVGYEDVSVNIEATRLNVFIKKAQELDLQPFMGAAFYYDFIKNVKFNEDGTLNTDPDTGTPQMYIDLMQGREYTNTAGHLLYFAGILPALIYFSLARFVEGDSVHYSATGPVIKQRDDSEGLKLNEIAKLVSQHRSVANAHTNDIITFLDSNRSAYPLWRYNSRNTQARQPGPRLRSVDRTDVKGAYGYVRGYGYGNGFIGDLLP